MGVVVVMGEGRRGAVLGQGEGVGLGVVGLVVVGSHLGGGRGGIFGSDFIIVSFSHHVNTGNGIGIGIGIGLGGFGFGY